MGHSWPLFFFIFVFSTQIKTVFGAGLKHGRDWGFAVYAAHNNLKLYFRCRKQAWLGIWSWLGTTCNAALSDSRYPVVLEQGFRLLEPV